MTAIPLSGFTFARPTWQPLRVGGGGFTRDMSIALDGTKVCQIDVYGAYIYNPSIPNPGNAGGTGVWQQLCRPGPIPAGDPAFGNLLGRSFGSGAGAYTIKIAPSNSSVIYMVWLGMMYKSVNKGVTFVNQSTTAGGTWPAQNDSQTTSNGNGSGQGPPMAIDPINPNVAWCGVGSGLYFTQNGGTTWTLLSTSQIPLTTGSSSQYYSIAFDPASAQSGGMTQGIYAYSYGNGVYYSSNAGSTWTQLSGSGMPTSPVRLVCDKFGVAWVGSGSAILTYTVHSGTNFTANTWTDTNCPTGGGGGQVSGVAPDPASTSSATQRVIVSNGSGWLTMSTNGGTSWGAGGTPSSFNQVATDIPWLQTNEIFMSSYACYFDPSQTNVLYLPEGIGVWYTSPPLTASLFATSNAGGTYNSTTGVVTIVLSADIGATVGGQVYVNGVAGTGQVSQLNGIFTVVTGTSGTTLAYQAPTGLTATISFATLNGTFLAWFWTSQTSGIESLETTHIISPLGGHVGLCQWDRSWFQITNPNVYPTTYGLWPGNRQNDNVSQSVIFPGMGADYAPASPTFIAVNAGPLQSTAGQNVGSAFSTNGGVPISGFSLFANMPNFTGGAGGQMPIAVSTPSIIMVCASSGLWVTTNGGASAWTDVTPAGSSGWPNGFVQSAFPLAADRVTAGSFMGYTGLSNGTIYVTANSGTSWTAITPGFSFGNGEEPKIRSVYNNAGHYFICGGASYLTSPDTNNHFYRTINNGTTWTDVSNGSYTICDVSNWNYGAPNGGSYPTIFIYGTVNGTTGIWQSVDDCATWQQIGDAQFNGLTFDKIETMCGDMNVPGQLYVGFLGSGYLRYGV